MEPWHGALSGALALVVFVPLLALWIWRRRFTDGAARTGRHLFPKKSPRTVMAVWAHPGDELIAAGTLARMARMRKGRLILVYLTAGEAARDTGFRRDILEAQRPQEARAAGKLLRATAVEVLDFPDGGLRTADGDRAREMLRELIARYSPSVLVTFDERIGYYSHPDQMQAGRWVREVVEAGAREGGFPVRDVYHATLPHKLIEMARDKAPAFRDNYPRDAHRGLPQPTLAVKVTGFAGLKGRVFAAHRTQADVFEYQRPYQSALPAWLYYRLLDREYFALAQAPAEPEARPAFVAEANEWRDLAPPLTIGDLAAFESTRGARA